jgi:hypothetical protein
MAHVSNETPLTELAAQVAAMNLAAKVAAIPAGQITFAVARYYCKLPIVGCRGHGAQKQMDSDAHLKTQTHKIALMARWRLLRIMKGWRLRAAPAAAATAAGAVPAADMA